MYLDRCQVRPKDGRLPERTSDLLLWTTSQSCVGGFLSFLSQHKGRCPRFGCTHRQSGRVLRAATRWPAPSLSAPDRSAPPAALFYTGRTMAAAVPGAAEAALAVVFIVIAAPCYMIFFGTEDQREQAFQRLRWLRNEPEPESPPTPTPAAPPL